MATTSYYLALLSFLGGVLFGSVVTTTYPTILFIGLLALVAALVWQRTSLDGLAMFWLGASVVLLFFAFGLLRVVWHQDNFGHSPFMSKVGGEVSLTGVVLEEPEVRAASTRLIVTSEGESVLVTADRYVSVAYGDTVMVRGTLREPEAFVTDLGRTFDYLGYLRAQGIEYQISFADVSVLKSGGGYAGVAALLSFKHQLMSGIESVLPEPAAGLGEGLLLGVKQALGEDLERAFRETGIIHIVVLSGYNIMLIIAFTMYFVRGFSARTRAAFGLIGICAFALMVGLSATVLRACLMAAVLLLAEATGRRYLALRALFLAAGLMLLWNPYLLLYDIGFQLSFTATLGLILITPHLERYLTFMPAFAGLRSFLGATVATQIAVLPLLLFHIGTVSLSAIMVNLLVLPLVPVAMLLTFGAGVLGMWGVSFAPVIGAFAYASLSYIITVAESFAALPLSSVIVPVFPGQLVVVAYTLLGLLLWYLASKREKVSVLSEAEEKEISQWLIEEDAETVVEKTKATAQKGAVATAETPIFFR